MNAALHKFSPWFLFSEKCCFFILSGWFFNLFNTYLLIIYLCNTCMCTYIQKHTCGGQRTISWSIFFPNMWPPRVKHRPWALLANTFTWRVLFWRFGFVLFCSSRDDVSLCRPIIWASTCYVVCSDQFHTHGQPLPFIA